jgi:hypothetical protein
MVPVATGIADYSYDPVGNRTSQTQRGTTSHSFDAADRMTAQGSSSFTDAQLNRLTGVSGFITASSAYNGNGKRVAKMVGGTTTTYT